MASPTIRRRLGIELKNLRQTAGMTIDEASTKAGTSNSHLSRVERGRTGLRQPTLMALLRVYDADEETTTRLADAATESTRVKERDWWQPYATSISEKYATLISFESEATSIRGFEPLIVPGLLQTEEYARASLQRGTVRFSPDEIETRVEARLSRQAVLDQPQPPHAWFILDEAAIRRVVGGPDVMRAQLQHLVEMATRPQVDLQVIPFSAGAHPGPLGPLVILGFAEGEDVVYCETYPGDLYPKAGSMYGDVFNRLAQVALACDSSAELVRDVAEELK